MTSQIFCYVVENNFSIYQKKKLTKFGDTFFGNSRSRKDHKVKQVKKKYFFSVTDLGILGEFLLRICFSDTHGTCRF